MLNVGLCQFIHTQVAGDVEKIPPHVAAAEPFPIDSIPGFMG